MRNSRFPLRPCDRSHAQDDIQRIDWAVGDRMANGICVRRLDPSFTVFSGDCIADRISRTTQNILTTLLGGLALVAGGGMIAVGYRK
jgi:hypothetical protein